MSVYPLATATSIATPSTATKLAPLVQPVSFVPRKSGIARSRLVEAMERASSRRLVLLTAPAGWGKTNVVTDWAHQTAHIVIWCALDGRVISASSLLGRIVEAFARELRGPFEDLAAMCRTATTPDGNRLVAALAETCRHLDHELTLVLDDLAYGGDGSDAMLDALLDELPDRVHLVITSRVVYPRPVARLRLRGAIAEFGIEDLRFQADEVEHFWATIPGVHLSLEDITLTCEVTEGWPGGLGLMAIAMSGSPSPSAVLHGFTGAHREAAAYLAEEVFNHQASVMKRFLVGASLLDRFTADACDAIFQGQGSRELLASLITCNPFLIPLDAQGEWFRFHRMFGEFLRTQVVFLPADVSLLRLRASRWLAEQDDIEGALPHAVASGDLEALLDLLERTAQRPTFHPELTQTFLSTVDGISVERLRSRPIVLRTYASLLTVSGRLDEARAMAEELCAVEVAGERGVPPEAEALAIKSRVAAYVGDDALTERWANHALTMLGQRDDPLRADLALSLGWAYRRRGDLQGSTEQFDRAVRFSRTSGPALATLWGTRYLALDWLMLGRLDDAAVLIDDEIARVHGTGVYCDFARAALLVGRAEIVYERNDLDSARPALDEAIAIARQAGDAKILANAYGALAWLERAHGDYERAHHAAFRAQRVMDGVIEDALLATIALDRGNIAAAQRWAERSGIRLGDPILPDQSPLLVLTYARVRAAAGAVADAIAYLERAATSYAERGWLRAQMQAWAGLAAVQDAAGERDEALDALACAVRLAVPEGFVRSLLDAGPRIDGLLRELARSDRLSLAERQWAMQVITGPSDVPASGSTAPTVSPLVESLTERQAEILALVAGGHSNREIAEALFLAEGTVKAHVHQIYGKLMARNRVEAIANARRFGLIAG